MLVLEQRFFSGLRFKLTKESAVLRVLVLITVVLVGCVSTPSKTLRVVAAPPDMALLVSKPSDESKSMIKGLFGDASRFGAATLQSIDGAPGETTLGRYSGVHNGFWDWHFALLVKPGARNLLVLPTDSRISEMSPVSLTFNAEAGHEYLVGQIIETKFPKYRWQPVLIDQTSGVVLYPLKVLWKHGDEW